MSRNTLLFTTFLGAESALRNFKYESPDVKTTSGFETVKEEVKDHDYWKMRKSGPISKWIPDVVPGTEWHPDGGELPKFDKMKIFKISSNNTIFV